MKRKECQPRESKGSGAFSSRTLRASRPLRVSGRSSTPRCSGRPSSRLAARRSRARHSRYWHWPIRCRSSPGSHSRGMVQPCEACKRGGTTNTPPQSSIRELSSSSVAPFRHSARAGRRRTLTIIFSYASTRARSFPTGVGGKANGEWKAKPRKGLAVPFLEPSGESGKEESGDALVLFERGSKLSREQRFFPPGLPCEASEPYRKGDERAVAANGQRRSRQRQQNAGVDGMADVGVGSRADQFVIGFQRNASAPVPADVIPGPNRKRHTGHGEACSECTNPIAVGQEPIVEESDARIARIKQSESRAKHEEARQLLASRLALHFPFYLK